MLPAWEEKGFSFLGFFPKEFLGGPDPSQWEPPDGFFTPRKTHQQGVVPWLNRFFQVQKFLYFLELSIRGSQPNPVFHPVGEESLGIPKNPILGSWGDSQPPKLELPAPASSLEIPAWKLLPGDPSFPTPPVIPSYTNPALTLLKSHPRGKTLPGPAAGEAELTLRAGIPKRNP